MLTNDKKPSPMNTNIRRTLQFRNISVNREMDEEGTVFGYMDVVFQSMPSCLTYNALLGVLHDR